MTATLSREFEDVFASEAGYVCGSLRRLGVRKDDVEDVAQDVFVAVYRHFAQYDRSRPIRPWLFAFVYRNVANYRRRARHRPAGEEPIEIASDGLSPEDALTRARAAQRLFVALDALSEENRAVFVMHELDGFSGPEIAQALEIPLNTAYTRIRLARRGVEAWLHGGGGEP